MRERTLVSVFLCCFLGVLTVGVCRVVDRACGFLEQATVTMAAGETAVRATQKDLSYTLARVDVVLRHVNSVASRVDENSQVQAEKTVEILENTNQLLGEGRRALARMDGAGQELRGETAATLKVLRGNLETSQQGLADLDEAVKGLGPAVEEARGVLAESHRALENVTATTASVAHTADYYDRKLTAPVRGMKRVGNWIWGGVKAAPLVKWFF